MSTVSVAAALAVYAAALFAIGWWAQRRPALSGRGSSILAALALGVYCTSWTFYGAVGTAARSGWDYLPIYLGPILVFTLGLRIVRRTVALGKAHGATSLPDLLSRRFGRSARLAALVTSVATIVSIPYVALQLIAVSSTFTVVTGGDGSAGPLLTMTVGLLLAFFGLVFGTRNLDATKSNSGLVSAIAMDSAFKVLAFVLVAVAVLGAVRGAGTSLVPGALGEEVALDRFVVLTILAGFAVLCLPRQFHIAVVEARSEGQIRSAAPFFVGYLVIFAGLVLPLAAGGALVPGMSPDLFVLSVPAELGLRSFEIIAFTGGFAAAAGMVIVAGVALSTMVSSDIVLPLLSRQTQGDAFGQVLTVRRVTLCVLIAAAALFALIVPRGTGLASFGIVSFAGIAQLGPLLLAALFVPRATERGAVAGLAAGATAWMVFVLGPAFFEGSILDWSQGLRAVLPFFSDDFTRGAAAALILNGGTLAAVSLLQPADLEQREEAARFAAMSPTIRAGAVARADLRRLLAQIIGERDTDEIFAAYPAGGEKTASRELLAAAETKLSRVLGNVSANILLTRLLASGQVEVGDVMVLMGDASRELRFGQELLSTTLENLAEGVSVIDQQGRLVAWNRSYQQLFQYPEGLLKVGLPVEELIRYNLPELGLDAIARRVTKILEGRAYTHETTLRDGRIVRLQGRPVPGGGYVTSFSDVTEYREAQEALGESERATRFYTDSIPFPIAFSDSTLTMRFHNRALAVMVGRAGEDLTGRSLEELFGDQFEVRAEAMRRVLEGDAQRFVLLPADVGGSVTWQVTYVPQFGPDEEVAGFFAFYQDISQRRAAQAALEEANKTLESRVIERTAELRRVNSELDRARKEAEGANRSKTKFLAAASHDVLQPLNAARLFASSLEDGLPEDSAERATAQKVGAAIVSADTLLRSLLNLSKLEAGGVDPQEQDLPLGPYLAGIAAEFRPLADAQGLTLTAVPSDLTTRTDPGLLRSALQNLVSNALRYTDEGGVLIGVRRRGSGLTIDVVDTGRGIAEEDIPTIFEEFRRLKRDRDVEGAGLGLATVRRVASLLGHEVTVSSRPGKGTVFSVHVPRVAKVPAKPEARKAGRKALSGVRVLCVDNDRSVLEALRLRFERWGAETEAYPALERVRSAYANGAQLPDLLVLDYQLDDDTTGLDVFDFMRDEKGAACPAIVVTASRSPEAEAAIAEKGLPVLPKPVEPAALRALSLSLLSGRKG